jgi:uncharacterized protein YecE (DUF72 family)
MAAIDLAPLPPNLWVGTSSFSSDDWRGSFYPADLASGDYLAWYARTFRTVEIDATFYALPARRTVEGWARKVPGGFVFSLKVPKVITHDLHLENCRAEWQAFLERLDPLGPARGPLLFQFPYIAKGADPEEYESGREFRRRLAAFLPLLSAGGQYVVEVRNAKWLAEPLLDLLRAHGVALAFSAYYTMPGAAQLFRGPDPVTAPFSYIRFLGNHRQMDKLVQAAREEGTREKEWGELLVDRERETREWVEIGWRLIERQESVYAYFNNHFAGFAPGSVERFVRLWEHVGSGSSARPFGGAPGTGASWN